jgi:hypothetical protein
MAPDDADRPISTDLCLGDTQMYRVDPGSVSTSGMLITFEANQDLCAPSLQGQVPMTLALSRDAAHCASAECLVLDMPVVPPALPAGSPAGGTVCQFQASVPLPMSGAYLYLTASRTTTIFHTSAGYTAHVDEVTYGSTFITGTCKTKFDLAPAAGQAP